MAAYVIVLATASMLTPYRPLSCCQHARPPVLSAPATQALLHVAMQVTRCTMHNRSTRME